MGPGVSCMNDLTIIQTTQVTYSTQAFRDILSLIIFSLWIIYRRPKLWHQFRVFKCLLVPLWGAVAYLGVKTDEAREKEREGWGETEGREGKTKIVVRFPVTLLFGPQPAERLSLVVPCDGLWWTARCSSASWGMAMAPPVEGSRQPVRRSLLHPRHGGVQQAPASWRTAPTHPLPLGRQPPHLDPGAQQRALHTTCSSITPAPPPRAATGSLRFFLLPDLLSTAIPLSSEGCLTACPSFLPGFGTNVIQFVDMGRRRREPANN